MIAFDSPVRYGGPWFQAASALPVEGGLGSPRRLGRLLGAAASRPQRAIALIVLLLRSPRLDVALSDSAAGQALRGHLNARFLGILPQNRLCQGVLILPEDHATYLQGRCRRALRNNLRRAEAAGIECGIVTDPADAIRAVAAVLRRRQAPVTAEDRATLTDVWPALFDRPEVTLLMARDREGSPVAVAAVVADDEVCLIRLAIASSHEARWALHHHLVRTLIARSVKCVVSSCEGPFGALGLPREVQYYQHLLGYDLCHIAPQATPGYSTRLGPNTRLLDLRRRRRIRSAAQTPG